MYNIVWKLAHKTVGCKVQISMSFTEKENNLYINVQLVTKKVIYSLNRKEGMEKGPQEKGF